MSAQELLQQIIELMQAGQARGGGPRRVLDTRGFRLPEFDGEAGRFADWSFAFKRCIRAMSPGAYDALVEAETSNLDAEESGLTDDAKKTSGEVYDLLCQLCAGEAIAVIRGVHDCKGMLAWKKLNEKYRPRTLARHVQLLLAILCPPRSQDGKDLELRYVQWKEKLREENQTFGGMQLSDRAKIAILTAMLPPWGQEFVMMHADDSWSSENLWEKIRVQIANRVRQGGGPVPMDIGTLGQADQAEDDEVASMPSAQTPGATVVEDMAT